MHTKLARHSTTRKTRQCVANRTDALLNCYKQRAYQHKTVATAIRLLLGKLRDYRLQVLPKKKEAIIKTATTFLSKHVRANTYPLSRPPKESSHKQRL